MLLNKQEKQDRDDGEGKHGQGGGVWLLQAQNSGHEEMKHDHPHDDPAKKKTYAHVNVYRDGRIRQDNFLIKKLTNN